MTGRSRLLALGAAIAFGLTSTACGGDQAGQQARSGAAQEEATQPQIQVSDAELESFIRASMELEEFRSEMQKRMSQATGQEEGREVRQKLLQERDSIIQAAGLEGTERYNAITKAVKSNERLRDRYTKLRSTMEGDSAM